MEGRRREAPPFSFSDRGTSSNRDGLSSMPGPTLLIAAAAAGASAALPADVEIRARVEARDVRIEQQGRAEALVFVEPSAGERIEVDRNLPKGRARYRNLELDVHVEGRLADPRAPRSAEAPATRTEPETGD